MTPRSIQFAVVREDPAVERRLLERHGLRHGLLVASGGCTAFDLSLAWPTAELTLIDPNPAQLELVETKIECLTRNDLSRFNIADDDPTGLTQCGKFEGLFRGLRHFVHEFVADQRQVRSWFSPTTVGDQITAAFTNAYWRVGFELFFNDTLLHEMFGPAATQHAAPGSYATYFRQRLERGLSAYDRANNYFLHHIWLGCYLPSALPAYLRSPPARPRFTLQEGSFQTVHDLHRYDFIDLSNVMDWMSEAEARALLERLARDTRQGCMVLWRQLNNQQDRVPWFGDSFRPVPPELLPDMDAERSHFYEIVRAVTKET